MCLASPAPDGHISLDELRMMLSGQGPLSAVETPDRAPDVGGHG